VLPLALLLVVAAALVASGISPHDRLTWWLECIPVLIGAPLLIFTARRPLRVRIRTLLGRMEGRLTNSSIS